jgi:hypothetical protein
MRNVITDEDEARLSNNMQRLERKGYIADEMKLLIIIALHDNRF